MDSSKRSSSHQQHLLPLRAQSGLLSFPDPVPQRHKEHPPGVWGSDSSCPGRVEAAKKQQSYCRAAAPVSSCEVCSLVLQKRGRGRHLTEVLSSMGVPRKHCLKKEIIFIGLAPQSRIFPSYMAGKYLPVNACSCK